MTRHRILLGLLALLAVAVFFADLYLLPGTFMPAVAYMTAVLLAAYLVHGPRWVAAIAVWTLALQITSYWLQQPGLSLLPASYISGLIVVSLLCVVLSNRASREAKLRQQAETMRVRAEAALAEAERAVKARDEFISIAAHELKTPVTSLSGFAQLVTRQFDKSGTIDPERVVKSLKLIRIQSGKLSQLTEQLLNLSRLETGNLVLDRKEVDLAFLVRSVVEAVQHAHPERILELLDSDPLLASVDPLRIEQVITNLLDNAIKFSPHGAPVLVELTADRDGWAEIAVRDYGIGIPGERMEQIFEPFYSAHPERHMGGMGIGLHIAHHMVELHGGSIRAEQPEDGGSRFVVRLPLVRNENSDGDKGADEGDG